MHYIRFLQTPKVHVDKATIVLRAVITVTTDLGETFYPEDVELVVNLSSPDIDNDIYLRRKVQWNEGARSLKVAIDLSRQDLEWPVCMHVSARNSRPGGFLPPICDVWSGSVNPVKGQFDSGRRVERRFLSLADRPLSLLEDAGDSIARHLWDGSQALVQHIDEVISLSNPDTLPLLEYTLLSATYRKLNVIELGCGVGTVGISLAQTVPDCDVILTDLPEAEGLVEANLARMRPAMASRAKFRSLDWLEPLPDTILSRNNHLIVVSECTYNVDTLDALVSTLSSLLVRSPKAIIVVSTKTRHESESAFFDIMRNSGFVSEGSMRLPLSGLPGYGYSDTATDVGLHIFSGREHRLSITPRTGSEEEVPTMADSRPSGSR